MEGHEPSLDGVRPGMVKVEICGFGQVVFTWQHRGTDPPLYSTLLFSSEYARDIARRLIESADQVDKSRSVLTQGTHDNTE